jgi:hypothetical protein
MRAPFVDHGVGRGEEASLFRLDVAKDVDERTAICFECMAIAFENPDNA